MTNLQEPGSGPRSLDYFGTPYRILGSRIEKWSNKLKIKFLNSEIPNIKTKYFLLLDNDDTFLVDNLSKVVETFETSFTCDMLINAAQNLWPKRQLEKSGVRSFCERIGDKVGSYHKFVNGGAWIARTQFYKEIMGTFDIDKAPLPGDDQSALYLLYKKHYPKIQLDHFCAIFQCEFDEELEVEYPLQPKQSV